MVGGPWLHPTKREKSLNVAAIRSKNNNYNYHERVKG